MYGKKLNKKIIKKYIIIASMLLAKCVILNSQSLTNAGFENWTGIEPNGWTTFNATPDNAEINGKQDIIRSTLKENGVFSEGKVRTEKLNNLILLTTYGDGQCGENKKRKGSKNCSLSGIVPPSRPNMNELLEDTRDLARIWDLYGHLLNEA